MSLTLITIVRNDISGLKETFSTLKDRPAWVKWVVVDGASNDGTVEYIRSISSFVDDWISEKDQGISDAFNKGVQLSDSDYVLFLNAGDTLLDGFFSKVSKILSMIESSGHRIAVGRIDFAGRIVGGVASAAMQKRRNYLPHQAMLIKSSVFREYGGYDLGYRLGMDYEWSLRLVERWCSELRFFDDVLVYMDDGGVSVTNYVQTFIKYHEARMKNGSLNRILSIGFSSFFVSRRWLSLKLKEWVDDFYRLLRF